MLLVATTANFLKKGKISKIINILQKIIIIGYNNNSKKSVGMQETRFI